MRNYQRSFAACEGDYVAILEGDDYRTSPDHLRNHLEFLDAHREVVLSMNRILIHEEAARRYATWYAPEMSDDYPLYTTQDMARGNKLADLSGCVIRNRALQHLPPELFDLDLADWMFGMALGEQGYLAILKRHNSLYRIKGSGLWAGKSADEQKMMMLNAIETYDRYFKGKYKTEFNALRREVQQELAAERRANGPLRRILRSWPALHRTVRRLRG